jgi:hypothetical protein
MRWNPSGNYNKPGFGSGCKFMTAIIPRPYLKIFGEFE